MMHEKFSKTMAAVQLTGHGGLDKLVYNAQVPVPMPAAGEVLISVTACGMNNTDVWVREGAYGTEEDAGAVSTWRRQEPTLDFSANSGNRHCRKHSGCRRGRSAGPHWSARHGGLLYL